MTVTAPELIALVSGFFWPFIRIGAMFVAAPLLGAQTMPLRVRIAASLALTAVVAPLIEVPVGVEPFSLLGLLTTFQQVLIGAAMGFTLQLVFSAMTQAGEAVAMSMGLGFASMMDPQNGVQVPVVSQYYVVVSTLIFLALNGHLVLIEMVYRSFDTLPVAAAGLDRDAFWLLVQWGSEMFAGAVLVALPAVAALMLVNIAFGVITRAAPQLNIFAVGFPMTLLIGFVMMLLSLPSLLPQVTDLLLSAFGLMERMTAGGAP
jgi:flagellar biosynthetic protein FliR